MSGPKHSNATSFRPGQSGNPNGRKKGAERIAREAAAARSYTANDGKEYTGLHALVHCLIDIAFDKTEQSKDRIVAANSAIDRGWGKPKQALELSGEVTSGDAKPLDASTMSDTEIAAALDAINTLRQFSGEPTDEDSATEH